MSLIRYIRGLLNSQELQDTERYLIPGLAVLTSMTVAMLVFTVTTLTAQSKARADARYALDTATLLENIYTTLVRTESSQRGYVLTGDESYLTSYTTDIEQVPKLIRTLSGRVQAAPLPNELQRVQQLANEKLSEMAQTVSLRRSDGFEASQAVIKTNAGASLMDNIHTRLQTMEAQVNEQVASGRRALDQTTMLIYAGLSVLSLLTVLFALFVRQLFERLRLQRQRLETLNTELNRSNRELQDFASVASHDLQEPLRKIQAFSDRLRSAQAVSDNGQVYLERILDATARMRTLIEDLLAYSRVTTRAQPFTRVSLGRVVRGVLSDMETSLDDAGATVTVQKLPTIDADAVQMRQVFQNLISNGVKFRREGVAPRLSVYSTIIEDADQRMVQIVVEDNGIGFDTKYLDRIFTIFQRLHGRNEYEGTGIGLAVVRKIVERHTGTITATSQPGNGARFIVTLPTRQP